MSRRPTLAFNRDDGDLAADLSKRAKGAADKIRKLLPHLQAGLARRAGVVADDLGAIADTLHPVVPRFATHARGVRCYVGIVDSRSMTLYRLLPCPKAGALNLGMKQSVGRHTVKEWPTLDLAVAYARLETAHQQRQHKLDHRHWHQHRQRERRHSRAVHRLQTRAAKVQP